MPKFDLTRRQFVNGSLASLGRATAFSGLDPHLRNLTWRGP
jgi:hypothetical protein